MRKCLNCGKEYSGKRYGWWIEDKEPSIKEIDLCTLRCLEIWENKNKETLKKINRLMKKHFRIMSGM